MSIVERLATARTDRYRIDRELGPAGMATAYLAFDLEHERPAVMCDPRFKALLAKTKIAEDKP